MLTDEEVKGKVLHKLVRAGKIEHSHTALEHAQKGFPKDMIGRVKALVRELIKEGVLHEKQTSYGVQISVNVEKLDVVEQYVELFLRSQDNSPSSI